MLFWLHRIFFVEKYFLHSLHKESVFFSFPIFFQFFYFIFLAILFTRSWSRRKNADLGPKCGIKSRNNSHRKKCAIQCEKSGQISGTYSCRVSTICVSKCDHTIAWNNWFRFYFLLLWNPFESQHVFRFFQV